MPEAKKIVDCRYGRIITYGDEDLISRSLEMYGEWAQGEIDVLAKFISDGDVVIDAGAFIGTHARAFSSLVTERGKVHAFEPNHESYLRLTENAALAGNDNIETHQCGLGSAEEFRGSAVTAIDENRGAFSLDGCDVIEGQEGLAVKPLDNFAFERVDLLKVDVEGMELEVLKGAEATIERCRPVIFLEVNTLHSTAPVLDWANARGYRIFGLLSRAFNPENYRGESANIYDAARECGIILVPELRADGYFDKGSPSTLELPEIRKLDDLALLLLQKPQYLNDLLLGSQTATGSGPLSRENHGVGPSDRGTSYFFTEFQMQLAATAKAKDDAEGLALERLSKLEELDQRLVVAEEAKNRAEYLALERLSELEALDQRLSATEEAKTIAEDLALERLTELEGLIQRVAMAEGEREAAAGIARERLQQLEELQQRYDILRRPWKLITGQNGKEGS